MQYSLIKQHLVLKTEFSNRFGFSKNFGTITAILNQPKNSNFLQKIVQNSIYDTPTSVTCLPGSLYLKSGQKQI